jgi:transposase-like protein
LVVAISGDRVVLLCVRWYLAYPLSYRNLEEMMGERGIEVDHSSINRWVLKHTPLIEKNFKKYKREVNRSWRLDETSIKVKGKWNYLYRAVDTEGNTIDFLLSKRRNTKAALRFLRKAVGNNNCPRVINIDKSGANKAGILAFNIETSSDIELRQIKYLNNIIEQDHRKIKRKMNIVQTFKSYSSAKITLAGIEIMAQLKKNQADINSLFASNFIDEFYESDGLLKVA